MITRTTSRVRFDAGTDRSGPLAWGQQGTWDVFAGWLPQMKPFFVLNRWLSVPPVLELSDVLAVLVELVRRHEALRTRFRPDPSGEIVQTVLGSGQFEVCVLARPADDPVTFTDIVTDRVRWASETAFDFATELPVRLSVAMHESIPVLIIFGVSHLAADYLSADLLAAELGAMVASRVAGAAPPPARPAWQPLDLAGFERSPDGLRHSLDALDHLREQLDRTPERTFEERFRPALPRFHRAELHSSAMPPALRAGARRHRTGTSALLLGVCAAVVKTVTGSSVWPVTLMQGNRRSETLHTVSSLNQAVYTALDISADDLNTLIVTADSALAQSRRFGRFDQRASAAVVDTHRRRTGSVQPGSQFNDMWSAIAKPRPPVIGPAELAELAGTSTIYWPETSAAEGLSVFLDVRGAPERIELSLMADTALFRTTDIERILRSVERVVLALAYRDVDLAEVAGLLDRHGTLSVL